MKVTSLPGFCQTRIYKGCLTIHATQIHTDNLLLRPVTPKMIAFPGSRYDNNKKTEDLRSLA